LLHSSDVHYFSRLNGRTLRIAPQSVPDLYIESVATLVPYTDRSFSACGTCLSYFLHSCFSSIGKPNFLSETDCKGTAFYYFTKIIFAFFEINF